MSETAAKNAAKKTPPKKKAGTIAASVESIKIKNIDPGIPDDAMIACMSYISGTLLHTGKVTGTSYQWDSMGAIENVQYADLRAELNSPRSKLAYVPYIIILDDEVWEYNERLKELYENLYTHQEIERILTGSDVNKARAFITGAKKELGVTVRSIIAQLVKDGRLTNRNMLSMADEVLNTSYSSLL